MNFKIAESTKQIKNSIRLDFDRRDLFMTFKYCINKIKLFIKNSVMICKKSFSCENFATKLELLTNKLIKLYKESDFYKNYITKLMLYIDKLIKTYKESNLYKKYVTKLILYINVLIKTYKESNLYKKYMTKLMLYINKFSKEIFGIILIRMTLDFIYVNYISLYFRYYGFLYEPNLGKYILSWILLIIFIPYIINLNRKITFSSLILTLLVYLSFLPFTTMIAFYPFSMFFIFQNYIYWLILFLIFKYMPKIKFPRLKQNKISDKIIYSILIVFMITVLFISCKFTGFRLTLDIFSVYELREAASNFKIPIIISYIFAASKVINPILMVYYFSKKKNKIAFLILVIQLLSFSIDGSKSVLVGTFIAALLYWLYKDKYILRIPWLFSFFGLISISETIISKNMFIINFIIRRVFFLPNLLHFYYYDFFTKNTPDYFRQSFLRYFNFRSPYPIIDNMIGDIYFNKPEMGANNGLISDAFTNFGLIGIIIMPLFVILVLKILDACSEGLNNRIIIASAIIITFIFISSFFFTILLTHGLIALCIILYLLPREYIE